MTAASATRPEWVTVVAYENTHGRPHPLAALRA